MSLIFSGFYLHFLPIIYEIMVNDDLKTRTYMNKSIGRLIEIQRLNSDNPDDCKYVIDITCALSLQNWDNMRSICSQLEDDKNKQYDAVFMFLMFYAKVCFILWVLCRSEVDFL
jgi:hypothetical protein